MEVIGHNIATAALSRSKINLISRRTQPPWWWEHSPGHLACRGRAVTYLFLLLVVLFLVLCPVLDQFELRVVSREPFELRVVSRDGIEKGLRHVFLQCELRVGNVVSQD